jgi:hypothetical protein
MEGLTFERMVGFFIVAEFESLEMTYLVISKGCDDHGVFVFI